MFIIKIIVCLMLMMGPALAQDTQPALIEGIGESDPDIIAEPLEPMPNTQPPVESLTSSEPTPEASQEPVEVETSTVADLLDVPEEPQTSAHPFQDLINALEKRLVTLNAKIEAQNPDDKIEPIEFPDRIVKEGYVHPHVALLRERLDEYFTFDVMNADPHYFDSSLKDALKKYQAEMGLKSDGIIGPETLDLLNRTYEAERKQVKVNLARLRQPEWLDRPPLRIDVDIARYWLTAYEDNKVAFDMPVVVGRKERQTNRFSTVMTGVRLNPGWTLPPTIKSEDYIPKLRENPEWLNEQGVLIYASWDDDAEPIDPLTIDWNYLPDTAIRAMRFYKLAGDNNPLGRYRFLMSNQYDIYLHDTNQKYLFDRDGRAFSSGCVRVYDPRQITEFLLQDNPEWTDERLDEVIATGDTYNVRAKRYIPVFFDYKTAWLDEEGQLVLGNDIYDLDDTVDYDTITFDVDKIEDSVERIDL